MPQGWAAAPPPFKAFSYPQLYFFKLS